MAKEVTCNSPPLKLEIVKRSLLDFINLSMTRICAKLNGRLDGWLAGWLGSGTAGYCLGGILDLEKGFPEDLLERRRARNSMWVLVFISSVCEFKFAIQSESFSCTVRINSLMRFHS